MNIFRCQVLPSIIRSYRSYESSWASIGVTSFRPASFLFCLSSGCPSIEIAILAVFQDSRGICQFVPLDHRPPPTDLQLLHFPPTFLFVVLSTTVSLRLPTSSFDSLPRISSPFLLPIHKYPFNFFTISPFSSFYFHPLFLFPFSPFLFISICRSHFAHFLRFFFLYWSTHRRSSFQLARKKSRRS